MRSGIPTLTLHGGSEDVDVAIKKFRKLCSEHNLKRGDVLFKLVTCFNETDHGKRLLIFSDLFDTCASPKQQELYIDGLQKDSSLISESEAYKRFDQFCKDRRRNIVKELDKAMRHYLKSCKHYVNFI